MKNFLSILFIYCLLLIFTTTNALAIVDPLATPNNKYGIHIIGDNDLESAARLVNSKGGDWGYVTLVIREDERVTDHWQTVFDRMRRLHLIPIVRTATIQTDNHWEKPNSDDIINWLNFFDSLNWVVQNRYIIVGNEPNHAAEWGGAVNPEEYSDYFVEFSKRLKKRSDDYFIMPAGLDASAPNSKINMDELVFIQKALEANNDFFANVDGWASHSYPNPGFSGDVNDTGRGSIQTFRWEKQTLKDLGVKDLPIFITETGWIHEVSDQNNSADQTIIAENYKYAFENIWKDDQIVAITPFVLNYHDKPFDMFSWTKPGNTGYYDFYHSVRNLEKQNGAPIQIHKGEAVITLIPRIIGASSNKVGIVYMRNTGQSIWDKDESLEIQVESENTEEISPVLRNIKPGDGGLVYVRKI